MFSQVVENNQKTDFPWSVKIPSEAFDKARQENNGSAFVGVLPFINIGKNFVCFHDFLFLHFGQMCLINFIQTHLYLLHELVELVSEIG